VSDSTKGLTIGGSYREESKQYYGGYLIAESVAEANAPILRTEPELLASLEEMTKWAIAERDCFYEGLAVDDEGKAADPKDRAMLEIEDARINRAMAAIAKAKGE
jgi:hypothetical protein